MKNYKQKGNRLKVEKIKLLALSILLMVFPGFASVLGGNKVIRVEDYGAVADGKTDCTEAFKKAFAEAGKMGPGVTIQLSQGRYLLSAKLPKAIAEASAVSNLEGKHQEDYKLFKQVNKFNGPSCVLVENTKGVTLAGVGQKTEVISTCPMAGTFEFRSCSSIVMREFVIDYEPVPFTQGKIVNVDKGVGTFDYQIDDGFSPLSEYWFELCDSKWGVPFDEQRLFRQGGVSAIFSDQWEKLEDRTWRMNMNQKEKVAGLYVGDRYIHFARTHNAAIGYYGCAEISLENIHVYASPSASTVFYQCEGKVHINGLHTKPRPGSKRIFGPNADAVHCQSLREGPIIENCVVEGVADDAVNVYAAPSVITEIITSKQVRVNKSNFLRKGDIIQIIRPSKGDILQAGIEVAAVDGNTITFVRPVDGLKAGENHLKGDTIFNLSASCNGFIVRNNIFGGFRGRGVLVRSHHGLIENNVIRYTSGQGIAVCNEPDWPEGPIPADIIIRNNVLISVYRDQVQQGQGAIQVTAYKINYALANNYSVHKVVIENNRIIDSPGYAILLQGVEDAKVADNLVQFVANDRVYQKYDGIKLENCRNISINGFTMVDQWARIDSAVQLKGTKKEHISLENIHADLQPDGEMIREVK